MTPPNKPQVNCTLPIMALAVPALAPCFDMANAIALGPVKPIPETTRNKPDINSQSGAWFIKPALTTINAPKH